MSTPRYLLLSGELPGEGVWCTARTYRQLVGRVKEVWGEDFVPIFKYTLPCSPRGGEEEVRYYRETSTFGFSRPDGERDGTDPETLAVGEPYNLHHVDTALTGLCYVIIDDDDDFTLWYSGGAFQQMSRHSSADVFPSASPSKDTSPPVPLSRQIFAFRKTLAVGANGYGGDAMDIQAATTPGMSKEESAHYYERSVGIKDRLVRSRSSPAVKHSENDVVRVPMHSLLSPLMLLKLGVTVVLRHSNTSEVILHSDQRSATGGGCGAWGQLILKARSAWGVHNPILRYLDLTQGYMQMNITNVTDFMFWAEDVGQDRRELLVLERAAEGCYVSDTALQAEMNRYLTAQPPAAVDAHAGVHLETLVRKLNFLEQMDRRAAVQRPIPLPQKCLEEREAEELAARLLLDRDLRRREAKALTEKASAVAAPPSASSPASNASADLLQTARTVVAPASGIPEKHVTAFEQYERTERLLRAMGPQLHSRLRKARTMPEGGEGDTDCGSAWGSAEATPVFQPPPPQCPVDNGSPPSPIRFTERVVGDVDADGALSSPSRPATPVPPLPCARDPATDITLSTLHDATAGVVLGNGQWGDVQTHGTDAATSPTSTDEFLRASYFSVLRSQYPNRMQESLYVRKGFERGSYGVKYSVKSDLMNVSEKTDDRYTSWRQRQAADHHKALAERLLRERQLAASRKPPLVS